jgi:hydroxymethylpyrimidine pyrophosphatase-like HAD family hydrolase
MTTLHIGIDMHGTLITDKEERVPAHLVKPLVEALRKARSGGKTKVYLCTGNDLEFVQRKIEPEVLAELDGHILEMGCVVSRDGKTEKLLLDPGLASRMRELESRLKAMQFPEVYKFGRRLATIAMFTKFGTAPEKLLPKVEQAMKGLGFADIARPACSSVAVDITPNGYNKITGMRHVAGGDPVMGIADSMNDLELITGADSAVVPSNARPELMDAVKKFGQAESTKVRISEKSVTEAVIEALERVADGGD